MVMVVRRSVLAVLSIVIVVLAVPAMVADQAVAAPLSSSNDVAAAIASTPSGHGYWIATAQGNVLTYGDAASFGTLTGAALNGPVVAMAASPDGGGYWLTAADGGVFAFGDAGFHGSMGGRHLNAPVVGMAVTYDGGGYWLTAADGGVFVFGDAIYSGSLVGPIPQGYGRVTGIAPFPDNQHYVLTTAGGYLPVFGFTGGSWPSPWPQSSPLNGPMIAITNWGDSTNVGYWTAGSDGGVFTFGIAPFYGSMGNAHPNAPIVAMTATPSHHGYWLIGRDGGVFAFGDAPFLGSAA